MSNERIFEAFAGILIPGLGQLLQGRNMRFLGIFLGTLLLLPVFGLGLAVYLFGIVDAYRFEEEE